MHVFHYHLVTRRIRDVEARYIAKLGFDLVARHGRIGEDLTSFEAGQGWEELDAMGFKLRLSELERGAVNVVVQPGHWRVPRVDHLGIALDEDGYIGVLERASELDLKIQDHPGKRTFVATDVGYRIEVHPPRDWIDAALEQADELQLAELHLRADDPVAKAEALATVLELERDECDVTVGGTVVRFVPGGPEGRPELDAEVLV